MAKTNAPARQSEQHAQAAVARVANRTRATIDKLESDEARKQISAALGGLDPTRIIRAARSYFLHAPDPEAMAEVDPNSFLAACIDAAAAGLLPDGKEGYIVPRKSRAVWQASWRGLIKLVRRASNVQSFTAEVVYQAELAKGGFLVEFGAERKLRHKPYYMLGIRETERGEIVAAYATCRIEGVEETLFHVVDRDRLERARKASGNPFNDTPSNVWVKHPAPMARKTAIRDFVEFLPLPDHIRDLIEADREADETDVGASVVQLDAPALAPATGEATGGWGPTAADIRSRAPKKTTAPAPAPVDTTAKEPEPEPEPPREREPGEDSGELFDDEDGGRSQAP